ncbi:outer surface protein F precursor [Tritrichomonas foetus]|uniref:Outer surface protein F n=1 Tax=Tritrichomonas foetus TaxID=1144522 RepID=A0A1J4JE90_9EUKA|nr:outer surface protein F precursor [Tritrichomonas foetus]|eukprot:OHS96607.1 outer surface protein F precursor [Tritrichomonas foetus]
MTQFPYDLINQIKTTKQDIKDNTHVVSEARVQTIKKMEDDIKTLSFNLQQAESQTKDAQNALSSNQEISLLMEKKKELLQEKTEYENKIKALQKQIQSMETNESAEKFSAALSLIQSIAPVKITVMTPVRLSGIIAFGTPESTDSFDFDRRNPQEIPSKFWAKLQKCADARYNPVVNDNSTSFWNDDTGRAW